MTFWGIEYGVWCMIAYVLVAMLGVGVWWELQDEEDRDLDDLFEVLLLSLFWGLFVAGGVIIGSLWLLSWIPRGPVKLGKYLLNRKDIPEARVVNE